MTWFKVDDGLCFHPKAIAAGNAALGLWVRAGSWCGANLTEGWLPATMVGTLGGQKRDAQKLVHSGLWIHTGPTPDAHTPNTSGTPAAHTVGHEADMSECITCGLSEGYQFRDWDVYQPTKAQVEADRKASRERQAKHREAKRNGVSNGVTDTVTNPVTNATPTRPDPTSSSSGTTRGAKRATQLPDDWKPKDDHLAIAVEYGLDPAFELRSFRDYYEATGKTHKNWDAAFRTWLNKSKSFKSPAYSAPFPAARKHLPESVPDDIDPDDFEAYAAFMRGEAG